MKTVSRVINGEPNVREQTRYKVERTMQRLGYQPNPSARSLAGQRSYAVALAYDNPSYYQMEIQNGVLEACRAQRYTLMLAPVDRTRPDHADALVALARHQRIDGLLLIPPLTDDAPLLRRLHAEGIALACVSPRRQREWPGVRLEERRAARELVGEMLRLGHRRIAHIRGLPGHGATQWRLAGYRDALAAAGIAYDPRLVVPGRFDFASGVEAAEQLLGQRQRPSAVFAANDEMAAGVLRSASLRGLAVPRDLSVCGFDDTLVAQQVSPALATVQQPLQQMGRRALELLLARQRAPQPPVCETLPHRLLLRDSLGPPAPRR
ncbi:LacI family transcriptional regulator [Xanthomonas theicola]|uniref:LacI family transcriptional regulator n=2 Tax=Xanthomonas theicola TaxID=56464 RepID=A0A2S6ZMA4_9XANT|nr:LacI family transcriptional regulator [Xanthomonas theicola]QNH27082.1 substrate-binding domain-containing protein [Xanthomonas theicola]